MKRIMSSARYLVLIGVAGLALVSAAAFLWGVVETVTLLWTLATAALTGAADKIAIVGLLRVLDVFLIAAVLIIAALSLYELFIGDLDAPDALVVHDLDALKAKVIGITFLEHLVEWTDATATLGFGLAIAAVAFALTLLHCSSAAH